MPAGAARCARPRVTWRPAPLRALGAIGAAAAGFAQVGQAEYLLQQSFLDGDFSSKWHFWSAADPTAGSVEYLASDAAKKAGLVTQSAGGVRIGADTHSVLAKGGRPSVRLQSRSTYQHGLIVAKISHMPTGCGTWSALWMYGEDQDHRWPTWGEYDIVEGVDSAERVMTSLHTTANCSQRAMAAGHDFTGSWASAADPKRLADQCYIHAPGQWENQGCSQYGPQGSMGPAFNAAGGGTFAALWDPTGVGAGARIATWFWKSGEEPKDVSEGKPNPEAWGVPYSQYSLAAHACNPGHFANMQLVIDIDFCGDLGELDFAKTCAKQLGQEFANMTCKEFVRSHPELLKEAYWLVNRLDVYQASEAPVVGREPSAPAGAAAPHAGQVHLGPHGRGTAPESSTNQAPVPAWFQRLQQAGRVPPAAAASPPKPPQLHTQRLPSPPPGAGAVAVASEPAADADRSLVKVGIGVSVLGFVGVVAIFVVAQCELIRVRGPHYAASGRTAYSAQDGCDLLASERAPSPRAAGYNGKNVTDSTATSPSREGLLSDREESPAENREWKEAYKRFLEVFPTGRARI